MSPALTVNTTSKVSCLSWSPFASCEVAFADYRGTINVLHLIKEKIIHKFDEHTARSWSVHYNPSDSSILASASDDLTVKLWSLSQKLSLHTIRSSANVCTVKFSDDGRKIAFGGADHIVSVMDVRMMNAPLFTLNGHKKSVSYVSFQSADKLVTSSTDSSVRIWDVASIGKCVGCFTGHRNERNFVGLAVSSEYIACGSETNDIYLYSPMISSPLLKTKFGDDSSTLFSTCNNPDSAASPPSSTGRAFVSALAWRKGHKDQIVVGNSHGITKMFHLSNEMP